MKKYYKITIFRILFFLLFLTSIYGTQNVTIIDNNIIYIKKSTWYKLKPLKIYILKIKKNTYQPIIVKANDYEVKTLSSFAKEYNAICGINGGFFGRENNEILGLLALYGQIYSKKRVKQRWSILLDHYGKFTFKYLTPSSFSNKGIINLNKYRGVISVGNMLLENGRIVAKDSKVNPMSGIGENKNFIYLVVVDGRTLTSFGVNEYEFAKIFKELGCKSAIALDGGGSAEVVARIQHKIRVLNNPSDSVERRIATAILFIDKNTIHISVPNNFSPSDLNYLNRYYFFKKKIVLTYKKSLNKNIYISYKGEKITIKTKIPNRKLSEYYLQNIKEKYFFGGLTLYKFNARIYFSKKIKHAQNLITIYDGFDNYPLLLKNNDGSYTLMTSLKDLKMRKKMLNYLFYIILNDIIKNR